MRDFHVACGQFEARLADAAGNVEIMTRQAAEANDRGAEIIVFPELVVSGYLPANQVPDVAEPLDGPSVTGLRRAAASAGIAIAFGMALREAETMANAMVVVDARGEIAGVYRKIHLFGAEHDWATPGDRVEQTEIGGVPMSGFICYDARFPELARMAAIDGAEVCLVPTAWLGPGDEWELALRARAMDNGICIAGADIISRQPGLICRGLSLIVGPHGDVLARATPGAETVIDAVLEAEDVQRQRDRVPLLDHRRLGSYANPR